MTLVTVMVTTAKAGVQPGDIPLTDHGKAGLPEDCVIRFPRLTTLSDLQVSHRRRSIGAKDRKAGPNGLPNTAKSPKSGCQTAAEVKLFQ